MNSCRLGWGPLNQAAVLFARAFWVTVEETEEKLREEGDIPKALQLDLGQAKSCPYVHNGWCTYMHTGPMS